MEIIKNDFTAGLNLDDSPYRIPSNAYIDALNITKDAVEGSNDLIISNIVGNRLVDYTLPIGTNKVIGAYAHVLRNTIIYMVWNSNDLHSILEYNDTTRTIIPIFINLTDSALIDVLGFTASDKITSINVYPRQTEGDLLFFLDSLKRPTGLNIQNFKLGLYTPVTRDILDVAKMPPLSPPSNVYGNDTTHAANDLRNKLFRFKYRYIYDDFQKSTCSPIGGIPLPFNVLDDTYTGVVTNNNVIALSLNSGGKEVKKIELLMSFVNRTNDWSDFALVDTIDKSLFSLKQTNFSYEIAVIYTIVTITFTGIVTTGTVVNIYLTLLPSTQVLAGTYTAIAGDDIADVVAGLALSIIAIGIDPAPQVFANGLNIEFVTATYSFNRVDIINAVTDTDNIFFPYLFYNDSTYPLIDPNESILLFDLVPFKANAQELANGNVLTYWGITEGYNKDLVPNVVLAVNTIAAGSGISTGTLTGNSVLLGVSPFGNTQYQTGFSGIGVTGTIITIKLRLVNPPFTVITVATYTITALGGATASQVAQAMVNSMGSIGIATVYDTNIPFGDFKYLFSTSVYVYDSLTITFPVSSAAKNSIATFPFSTSRSIGIAYFDQNGKTNGILYDSKLAFPAYNENGSFQVLLPYINAKIYHVPPVWAYSYQWLLTHESTIFLYWITIGVVFDADYVYFNVTNLSINAKKYPTTAAVISWAFQDGDRLRLIRNNATNVVMGAVYDTEMIGILTNPDIGSNPTVGIFVKVKKTTPFIAANITATEYVIQMYRPTQHTSSGSNEVYYEFGEEYRIGDPTLSTRYHIGQVSNQGILTGIPAEFNFYNGDAYFRQRTCALSEVTAPLEKNINVQDRNFVDTYISAVNSIDGRPNIIDENIRESYYSAMVRFGQAYQPNTNINGLNRFYPLNFDEYDISFGDIIRVKSRDRYIRVFQKFKVGTVPIFNQISKNADGTQLLVVTDKLLNPIQYYAGEYGIGEQAESLATFNFADYFTTNIKGTVCRLSNDGLNPISVMYKINSWASEKLPMRTGAYKVYGAFDQRLNNYIFALEATNTDPAATLIFDEETKSFDSFISMHPEMMVTLGVLLVCFKDGQLWTNDSSQYNNFFGVQYDSSITPVFNQGTANVKSFMALEVKSNVVMDCPEIETSLISYGSTPQQSNLVYSDFKLLEGKWCSPLLRDSNSIGGINAGDQLKGDWIKIKLHRINASTLLTLNIASLRIIDSPLNKR